MPVASIHNVVAVLKVREDHLAVHVLLRNAVKTVMKKKE